VNFNLIQPGLNRKPGKSDLYSAKVCGIIPSFIKKFNQIKLTVSEIVTQPAAQGHNSVFFKDLIYC
jgi:hypothetical protein